MDAFFGPSVRLFFLEHPSWRPTIPSSCPVGWDPTAASALKDLLSLSDRLHQRIGLSQIKDKLGELRIDPQLTGIEPSVFTDIHGSNDEPLASRACYAIVATAAERSRSICQVCGERGDRRPGPWIRTLCDVHERAQP